jgi:ATP-dependent RNA helicase DDX41
MRRSELMSDANKNAADLAAEKEAELLAEMERGQKKLAGVQELAQGTVWIESLKTS